MSRTELFFSGTIVVMDEATAARLNEHTKSLLVDIGNRSKGKKPEVKPKDINPFTSQTVEVKSVAVKRRSGDGPAYLANIGTSPDAAVGGLRKNAGGVFENLGVRPHEARKKRTTWQDGVK